MKRTALAFLLLATAPAQAATAGGHTALALGALAGAHSPLLTPAQRARLASLLNGHMAAHPAIVVNADAVVCRAGDVDVTAFGCTLTFGAHTANLHGRAAHELFATLAEAGVPSDGAAGTIFEALHGLVCTIDPSVIAQRAGGGADCTFEPGPP